MYENATCKVHFAPNLVNGRVMGKYSINNAYFIHFSGTIYYYQLVHFTSAGKKTNTRTQQERKV